MLRCGPSFLGNGAAVAYCSIVADPERQELGSRQATRLSISRELNDILMEVVYTTKMSSGQLSAERA
jgi:hypothetical protein